MSSVDADLTPGKAGTVRVTTYDDNAKPIAVAHISPRRARNLAIALLHSAQTAEDDKR